MLGKLLHPPIRMLKDEVLLRRISAIHPKRKVIEDDLLYRRSGFKGEQSLDFYLSFLKEGQYVIYRGIRLQFGKYYFQIDVLLLSSLLSIIIENKNKGGKVIYDPISKSFSYFNQNNIEEAFLDPIEQAKRQSERLKMWLTTQQLPVMPIEYIVNFSNPSLLLKSTGPTNIFQKLGKSEHLLPKIYDLENRYKKEVLSIKEIKKINKTILKLDTPHDLDILHTYSVGQNEVIPGVQCPFCDHIPMIRKHSLWLCTSCKMVSKDAHIQCLNDYFLLYGPRITFKQFCDFLLVPDRFTGIRLINSLDLPSTGTHRSRIYFLNNDIVLK